MLRETHEKNIIKITQKKCYKECGMIGDETLLTSPPLPMKNGIEEWEQEKEKE